jgi:hypothetical protein
VRAGRTWDDFRDEVAELMIATVDGFAPNFARSIVARRALTPLDLEREFGLVGGDIFHGALALDSSSRCGRCWATPTTACRSAASTSAAPAPIRRRRQRIRAATRRGKCCAMFVADVRRVR